MTKIRTPILAAVALVATAAPAAASPADNSIQPGHVYMGAVQVGTHPRATLTYHNGTGKARKIQMMDVAGSGSLNPSGNGVFAVAYGRQTCQVGLVVPAGGTCSLVVKVATSNRSGWFRSVLSVRVGFKGHIYNSAELRAHIVR